MTTAAHVPSDVETYLARVRAALADVPADERDDLLAEVEASLHETASESGGSVAAQLGPPEDFAAELRSAAGLNDVGDASVYGTLRRLYRAGALTSYVEPSDEGPHRRYYGITARGRAQLAEARKDWAEFSQALSTLLETDVEVTA